MDKNKIDSSNQVKKKSYKWYLFMYVYVFLLIFILSHYLGEGGAFNLYYNPHSISWNESFLNIPYYLEFSLVLTIILSFLHYSFNKPKTK